MWTHVPISLGQIPKCKTAGSFVNFMLNLLKDCQTVFQSGVFVDITTSNTGDFNFSTSSPSLVTDCLFDYIHLGGYAVVTHCGFVLHFYKD